MRLACAKVNLTLHVNAPDARGYHPLSSVVAFADIGDEIRLIPGGEGLSIDGPFASGLPVGEDNLMNQALRLFEAELGYALNVGLHLTKFLPIAAGLGGGTADAGAVLKSLRHTYAPEMPDAALERMAAHIGADGVMCLWSRSGRATGYGECLEAFDLAPIPTVLIHPGVDCPTAAVYREFDRLKAFGPLMDLIKPHLSLNSTLAALRAGRNDLETAAVSLRPVIAACLDSLRTCPKVQLARLSGSGATCYGLCEDEASAILAEQHLKALWPDAWVRRVTLS